MPPADIRSRAEFIGLIASTMMIVAFAIDSMLPALPAIGQSLGVTVEARRSLVIVVFSVGFGSAQIFVGTISDRFGRRGLLLVSLIGYAVFGLTAAVAPTFPLLLAARVAQGAFAAGARVVANSVVRDRFVGREMAQVMSLASGLFMAAPILAPSLGTLVLAFAPWRWIFVALALLGAALWVWVFLRLPETLRPEHRRPISVRHVIDAARIVIGDRQSLGYTIAMTCLSCSIMGFLTSVQPIFADVFHHGDWLPAGFAFMAGSMAVASLTNSRIVMWWGMRRIGHTALILFTAIAAGHALFARFGHETVFTFIGLQSAMMICFALTTSNFGAMAMEHMAKVAGSASSIQGSFSTVIGALGGAAIGLNFNGTTAPLYVGVTIAGLTALAAVLIAERGRLFATPIAVMAAAE